MGNVIFWSIMAFGGVCCFIGWIMSFSPSERLPFSSYEECKDWVDKVNEQVNSCLGSVPRHIALDLQSIDRNAKYINTLQRNIEEARCRLEKLGPLEMKTEEWGDGAECEYTYIANTAKNNQIIKLQEKVSSNEKKISYYYTEQEALTKSIGEFIKENCF